VQKTVETTALLYFSIVCPLLDGLEQTPSRSMPCRIEHFPPPTAQNGALKELIPPSCPTSLL